MSKSIIEFIREYKTNSRLYAIPDFQREFTWEDFKIEKLFDSIFRKYPLPRFFMWSVPFDTPVTLFNMVQSFVEKPYRYTEFKEEDYQEMGHIAICDGQQRLTALLIGFLGKNFPKSVKSRKPYYLYFDILFDQSLVDLDSEHRKKRFSFLTEEKSNKENELGETYWVKVSDFFNFYLQHANIPAQQIIDGYLSQIGLYATANPQKIILASSNLQTFLLSISQPNYLDFQNLQGIIGTSLDEAVEFFKRINSGGKSLTKNNILFSLVSRHLQMPQFEQIRLRSDFEKIAYEYSNNTSGLFKKEITWDFFLRACLYITSNEVLFRVNTFNQSKCVDILSEWPAIKESIVRTFELIRMIHIGDMITSLNSLIPVIYHFYKKNNNITDETEKNELLKYLIRAQFSNVFGSHGDSLLTALKKNQLGKYQNPNYRFSFDDLNADLPSKKSFSVDEKKIDAMLEYEYGDSMVKPILSLVTKGINWNNSFQVDHIHPEAICSSVGQLYHNDVVGNIDFIKENYNKLPNLQLLPDRCNQSKQDKPFLEWLNGILNGYTRNENDLFCLNGRNDVDVYLQENLINKEEVESMESFLSINNFRSFFERRKQLMRNILIQNLMGD